jgi:hypothetical protein
MDCRVRSAAEGQGIRRRRALKPQKHKRYCEYPARQNPPRYHGWIIPDHNCLMLTINLIDGGIPENHAY